MLNVETQPQWVSFSNPNGFRSTPMAFVQPQWLSFNPNGFRSAVPPGLMQRRIRNPNAKALGYCHSSLRDDVGQKLVALARTPALLTGGFNRPRPAQKNIGQ